MKATIAILLLVTLTACGRTPEKEDPALWQGSPENVSCVEAGGTFVRAFGNQFCSADGYYCIMPGEKAPCTAEDVANLSNPHPKQ